MICRGCGHPLSDAPVLCDLGAQPLANALLEDGRGSEVRYPLAPVVCERCRLVSLPELVAPADIFTAAYPYFSSQSSGFVEHARRYVEESIERFHLDERSLVVEIASNDGYLLKHFARRGVRCYGVEPARGVAEHAILTGVPTLIEFFDQNLVCERLLQSDGEDRVITAGQADLIVANNVLAHVPELHGFLHGISMLLAPEGVVTFEVPWLRTLVDEIQVGTIYHEHFSYFLLCAIEHVLALGASGLRVFDVELLPEIHGGSLRVFACHPGAAHVETLRVAGARAQERAWLAGRPLEGFARQAAELKQGVWSFLTEARRMGQSVAGYCAAAKAATLLTYAGVSADLLPYIADTTPAKQGRYLPGARIPIVSEERLLAERPDVVWILAPNWAEQIVPALRERCDWDPAFAWQDGTRIRYAPSDLRAAA